MDLLKSRAAQRAVEFVRSGMVLGLGHGSTAAHAVEHLAARLRDGSVEGVVGIPCSHAVGLLAARHGIPLSSLDEHPSIDLTIDGADEVDPNLDLIKGGGGALLREKVIASVSAREIIVVDGSKLSDRLGTRFPLPVEVIPFACAVEKRYLATLGADVRLRCTADGQPFRTDQGNYILDAHFAPINDAPALARQLDERAGIVAHGLFLGLATDLIVADSSGVHHRVR